MFTSNKTTAQQVLETIWGENEFLERFEVRSVLEDGNALTALGFTDNDQEAIEEAHALVSVSKAELLEQARDLLISDCEQFSDEELIDGKAFGACLEVAYTDGLGKVFTEFCINTDYTDRKLTEESTKEEIEALCDDLIRDALDELDNQLDYYGIE